MEPQAESAHSSKNARWSDLQTRALSAIILLAISFFCLWQGGVLFSVYVMFAAVLMMKEWENMVRGFGSKWRLSGYPYLLIPCACLIWLRQHSFAASVALVLIITATDCFAYFVGKQFGKHKLAPSISPKKTWEGLAGGVAGAGVVALFFLSPVLPEHSARLIVAVLIGVLLACLAQAGDLFKSYVKRRAGVKDSGTLIPGHGGLIDRLDGYMFTAPVLALFLYWMMAA